jgi:hypothetical protein
VILLRPQLQRDMEAVERGEDPKGIIRGPDVNRTLEWPFAPWPKRMTAEFTRSQYLQRRARFNRIDAAPKDDLFGFYAGQPADIRREIKAATSL